jgi:hypothetical protein
LIYKEEEKVYERVSGGDGWPVLFGEAIIPGEDVTNQVLNIIPAEVLVGLHAGAPEDLGLGIDPDGIAGIEALAGLIPPELLAMEGIPLEDIPHDHAVTEEDLVLFGQVLPVPGVHLALYFHRIVEEVDVEAMRKFGIRRIEQGVAKHVGRGELAFDDAMLTEIADDVDALLRNGLTSCIRGKVRDLVLAGGQQEAGSQEKTGGQNAGSREPGGSQKPGSAHEDLTS